MFYLDWARTSGSNSVDIPPYRHSYKIMLLFLPLSSLLPLPPLLPLLPPLAPFLSHTLLLETPQEDQEGGNCSYHHRGQTSGSMLDCLFEKQDERRERKKKGEEKKESIRVRVRVACVMLRGIAWSCVFGVSFCVVLRDDA